MFRRELFRRSSQIGPKLPLPERHKPCAPDLLQRRRIMIQHGAPTIPAVWRAAECGAFESHSKLAGT